MHVSNIIQGGVKLISLSETPQMEIVEEVKNVNDEEKFKLEPLKLSINSKVEKKTKSK